MSYQKQLQEHYKAVRARMMKAARKEPLALPKPMPPQLEEEEEVKAPRVLSQPAGLVIPGTEGQLVTEALREANPDWIGGNHTQAIRIAEQMMSAPKLPPLPGVVINEIGAIRWMRVLHAVAAMHDVKADEILSTSRKHHVIRARFEVFYRLRVDLNYSYTKISKIMKRDHSTVMHGVGKIKAMLLDGSIKRADYEVPRGGNHSTLHGAHTSQSVG